MSENNRYENNINRINKLNQKQNLPSILKTDNFIDELVKDEKLSDKAFLRSSLLKNEVYHLAAKTGSVDSAQMNWSDKMEG